MNWLASNRQKAKWQRQISAVISKSCNQNLKKSQSFAHLSNFSNFMSHKPRQEMACSRCVRAWSSLFSVPCFCCILCDWQHFYICLCFLSVFIFWMLQVCCQMCVFFICLCFLCLHAFTWPCFELSGPPYLLLCLPLVLCICCILCGEEDMGQTLTPTVLERAFMLWC